MNDIDSTQKQQTRSRSLWRNVDFLLIWSGQTVSVLGTNISALALPLLVLAVTHSPTQAGLLTAVRQFPYLIFSLPAGALLDRWNRKRTMIYCDLIRWIALGSVPLAFVTGHLALVQLYIVAFVEGTAYVFFSIGQIAALPQVVAKEHLPQAYAMDNITEYAGQLLGPSLGGFIIGLAPVVVIGANLAYALDSLSYLASVITLRFVKVPFQMERRQERRSLRKEIGEGLRFVWNQPLLRIMAILTMNGNFLLSPVTLVVIVLAQNTLHISVQVLGIILAAGGVGGVPGGFVAAWIREHVRFGLVIIASIFGWTLALVALTFASSPVLLIAGVGLIGFTWPVYGVTLVSYRLSVSPDYLQGRVNSAFRFLTYGAEPLGAAFFGLLLSLISPRMVLGVIAIGLALNGMAACLTRLRRT
ncbi:MAG TPA: MFS transporter [Ktedonobacteraceae bacterium]|nr:MFS transporter [Ktedonobacteraceae bacterium]